MFESGALRTSVTPGVGAETYEFTSDDEFTETLSWRRRQAVPGL